MDPLPFVAEEEERPVEPPVPRADRHRTANGHAELVLIEPGDWLRGIIEVIKRIEGAVAQELHRAALQLVRSRLGDDVDQSG